MNETLGSIAMLLPIAVQWLRAQKKVPEWATLFITALIGLAAYGLYTGGNPSTREFWQHGLAWVLGALGVTQITSSAANLGVAAIPRTNSQG